jgi:hypothetical protein
MGVPEEDARHFDAGFRAGGTLVTVDAGARAEEARECLYESGADLGSMGRGVAGSRMSTSAAPADRMPGPAGGSQWVELREEELRAEKERVQAGEVPVRGDSEAWRGNERRYRQDSGYSGPERRVAQV